MIGIKGSIFIDQITVSNLVPSPPGMYPAYGGSQDTRFSDANLARLADYRESLPPGSPCPRLFWDNLNQVILPTDDTYGDALAEALSRDLADLSWDELGRVNETESIRPRHVARPPNDFRIEEWNE